jgi:hypothetical protein
MNTWEFDNDIFSRNIVFLQRRDLVFKLKETAT